MSTTTSSILFFKRTPKKYTVYLPENIHMKLIAVKIKTKKVSLLL